MQKSIKLKPLKRISPSRFTALRKCPYRVVLANSCPAPLLPYPPANHLGTIIHECIRLIIANEIKTDTEFNEKWNQLLAREEKTLEDMGFGFCTPLSENVKGYTIRKLQTKCLLKTQNRPELSKQGRKTQGRILTEQWLQSHDSLIGGFVDIISLLHDYIKLSDFKSGKILIGEGEVKEEYEDQLRLYSYLHHETFGRYPDELSVIDLESREYSVAFTPEECKELARNARMILAETNDLIELNEREKLAKPNLDNCQSCLYRPACDFYWDLPFGDVNSAFNDIRGYISKVKQFPNGNINTTLDSDKGRFMVFHIKDSLLSILTEAIGKEVAFFNVMGDGMSGNYRAIKTTQVYEI